MIVLPLSNSPFTEGFEAAWIEVGTVVRVDAKRSKVDWEGDHSDRKAYGISLSSPYIHQAFGEGDTRLPDLGAKAIVCQTSDDEPPLILGYYVDPESSDDNEGEGKEESFQSGRPVMSPGEYMYRGRKGNMHYLRRDGTYQLGASPGCQTFYVPVGNLLWNICKRSKLDAAGGQLNWEVKEVGGVGDSTEMRALLRESASDAKATVMVRSGNLFDAPKPPATTPSNVVIEVVVSPKGIDNAGKSMLQMYAFRIDRLGNVYRYTKGKVTTLTDGEVFDTLDSRRVVIKTDDSLTVTGNLTEVITGTLKSTAGRQEIKALADALVEAVVVRLGGQAASQPLMRGIVATSLLANHKHPIPGKPSPELASLASALSTKVLTE